MKKQSAFTLIELMIIVMIIGILVAMYHKYIAKDYSHNSAQLQAAAISLGFAVGGIFAVMPNPPEQRIKSLSGLPREEAAISDYMERLAIAQPIQKEVLSGIFRHGINDPNPQTGAESVMKSINLLRTSLEASQHPSLAKAMRAGFALGHSLETYNYLARARVTNQQLQKFSGLLKEYRKQLATDIVEAQLPRELAEAFSAADRDVISTDDLPRLLSDLSKARTLAEKLGHDAGVAPSRVSEDSWSRHTHPRGYSYSLPSGWTVKDDPSTSNSLVLPPSTTMDTAGPKTIVILTATPAPRGERDPFFLHQYLEAQMSPAKLQKFSTIELSSASVPRGILRWEVVVPEKNVTSGFASYVSLIKEGWAVHIDVYGPTELAAVHDATFRRMIESVEWK